MSRTTTALPRNLRYATRLNYNSLQFQCQSRLQRSKFRARLVSSVASARTNTSLREDLDEGGVDEGSEILAMEEEHGKLKDDLKVLLRDMAQPVAVVTSFMPRQSHFSDSTSLQGASGINSRLKFHGATLSSFSSIAMDPYPLITFSLRLHSRMATTLSNLPANLPTHMVVNLLSSSQAPAAIAFSRPDLHPAPFDTAGVEYRLSEEGLPVLQGGVGALSCRLVGRGHPLHDLDHLAMVARGNGRVQEPLLRKGAVASQLFIARVVRVEEVEGSERTMPLVYHRRSYTSCHPKKHNRDDSTT